MHRAAITLVCAAKLPALKVPQQRELFWYLRHVPHFKKKIKSVIPTSWD
jgi:hypothetical protein